MSKPRILVVEDQALMAELIAVHLENAGCEALGPTDRGETAIHLAEQLRPDLVLMDINLAGEVDGLVAAEAIFTRFGIRCVLLTSLDPADVLPRAQHAAPLGFLQKPITAVSLRTTIQMALHLRDAQAQLHESRQTLAALLQTASDGVLVTDPQGRIMEANETLLRLTGQSRAELLGRSVRELAARLVSAEAAVELGRNFAARTSLFQFQCTVGGNRRLEVSFHAGQPNLASDRFVGFVRDITAHHRTQAALQSTEHRLRLSLAAGRLGVFEHKMRDGSLLVSPEFCQTVGLPIQAAFSHAEWLELVHPHDRDEVRARWQRLRDGQNPVEAEYRLCLPNQGVRWLRVIAAPAAGADDPGSVLGVVQDITRQRKAESELRKLSSAVEQSPASIVVTDPQGIIEYVNPKFTAVTGYSLEEARGQNPRILKSGATPAGSYGEMWRSITAGQEWRGEFHNRKKNGELYWELASISPIRDERDNITHFVAVKEDITARKRSDAALMESEEKYRALFDRSLDCVFLHDFEGRFLDLNPAALSLLGYQRADIAALTFSTVLDPDHVSRALRVIEEVGRLGRPGELQELTLRRKDGSLVQVETKSSLVMRDGRPYALQGIARDITARKKGETQLLQSNAQLAATNDQLRTAVARERELTVAADTASRAKSAFLAAMSHELRTPLNVINGVAATLLDQPLPADHRQALELSLQSGQGLLTIIEEILDYTALQAGKARRDAAPFELTPFLQQLIGQIGELPAAKRLTLTLCVDPRLPSRVVGDARHLRQVLLNLLSNAVKFTERGAVHLTVRPRLGAEREAGLHFSVVDTGIGIDVAHQRVIFQPFVQADSSIQRRFGGTGLGLAIAHSFVELMGGEMRLRSRANVGSAFHFSIPAAAVPEAPPVWSDVEASGLRGARLLLATTVCSRRRMLAGVARSWGMQVTVFDPGRSASPSDAGAAAFDIALLDADLGATHSTLSGWLGRAGAEAPLPIVWLLRPDRVRPAGKGAPTRSITGAVLPPAVARELSALLARRPDPHRSDSAPAGSPPATPLLGQRLPLAILAADDAHSNRHVLGMMLRHLGYACDMVENGAEALIALRRKPYDLVLLDVQMPVMDGLAAAREIRQRQPAAGLRPKIVALTANALAGDRETCLAAGMDDYLSKPLVPANLVACIQRHFSVADVGPLISTCPAPAPTSVLIDEAHLQVVTQGMPEDMVAPFLAQLQATVAADFAARYPQVQVACADQDSKALHAAVHGLKGCFQTLGWNRAADACILTLTEVRAEGFTRWAAFAQELQTIYQTSDAAMTRHLADRQPAPSTHHELL